MSDNLIFNERIDTEYSYQDLGSGIVYTSHFGYFEYSDVYVIDNSIKIRAVIKTPLGGDNSKFYIDCGSGDSVNFITINNNYWNGNDYVDNVIQLYQLYVNGNQIENRLFLTEFDYTIENIIVIEFKRSGLVTVELNGISIYSKQCDQIASESGVFNYFYVEAITGSFGTPSYTPGYVDFFASNNVWTDYVNCGER